MYVVTSIPLVSRPRATLRSAEFGFLGVVVYTRVQTPRRWGAATRFLRPLPDFRPGVASFFVFGLRPLRTSWDVVGITAAQSSNGPLVPRRAKVRGWRWGTRASPRRRARRRSRTRRAGRPTGARLRAGTHAAPRPRRSAGSRAPPRAASPASR